MYAQVFGIDVNMTLGGNRNHNPLQMSFCIQTSLSFFLHAEPVVVTEKGEFKPEKSDQPLDLHLLKLILEEVQATRQHARRQDEDKRKPGRYTKLAEIIDTVFFCLYFLTVVMFLVCMFSRWIPKDYFT